MSCLSRWGEDIACGVFSLRLTYCFRRRCADDRAESTIKTHTVSVQTGQPQSWSKAFGTESTLVLPLARRFSSDPSCVPLAAWKSFNWSLPNSCNAVLNSSLSFFFLPSFPFHKWLIDRQDLGGKGQGCSVLHAWIIP